MEKSFLSKQTTSVISFNRRYNIDYTLTSKEITESGVTTKEEYGYKTSTLQLINKKVLKSDGNNLEYKYFYPNDYIFTPYTKTESFISGTTIISI